MQKCATLAAIGLRSLPPEEQPCSVELPDRYITDHSSNDSPQA
jgi:hypothetical protein